MEEDEQLKSRGIKRKRLTQCSETEKLVLTEELAIKETKLTHAQQLLKEKVLISVYHV